MQSTIKQIYYGEKGIENIPFSQDYKNAEKRMLDAVVDYIKDLDNEQKELFNNMLDNVMLYSAELAVDNFTEGFKIGLALGFEARN